MYDTPKRLGFPAIPKMTGIIPRDADLDPDPDADPERQAPAPAPDRKASVSGGHEPWWRVHLFRGMVNDVRRRVPYYVSDWVDAWDYRVVPATVYMYFAK